MDDNYLFMKIIEERFLRSRDNYIMDNGDFLTPEQQSLASGFFMRNRSQGAFLYGGYEDAERKIPVFMPDYTGVSDEEQLDEYFRNDPGSCPLVILDLTIPKAEKAVLTHRDYLGALMGEGIRREKAGDIIVRPKGAQIIVLRELGEYLKDSMTSVGRATVTAEIKDISSLDTGEIRTEEKSFSVPSPRLDNVVSAVFGISRKSALEAISRGLVFVDSVISMKPDSHLKDGQKLVLRGKGKVIYHGVTGKSRKGNPYIKVTRYI